MNEIGTLLCTLGEIRDLDPAESDLLGSRNYLGCRNPVGLDHILVGPNVESIASAEHVSIGQFGRSRAGKEEDGSDQLLSISDHCPMVARLNL